MKKLFALTALLATVAFNANAQLDVAGAANAVAKAADNAAVKVETTKADVNAKVEDVKADVAAQKKEADDAAAAKKAEDEKAVKNMKNSLNNLKNAF